MTPKKTWQPVFIRELCRTGNVSSACRKAHISRNAAYEDRAADPLFAGAWAEALEIAVEALELEARRRAEIGVLDPVYQGGEMVGKMRKYSDTLLIFLLKAHKPEMYSDRQRADVTINGGGPIRIEYVNDWRETDA